MKNNKYLAELYESRHGKKIEHGLTLLLDSWKKQADCGSNHLYVSNYEGDRLEQEDIKVFIRHIKEAGIESFTMDIDCIAPEALHHFFLFSANSGFAKASLISPTYELDAWCGSNGSRWYTITILK